MLKGVLPINKPAGWTSFDVVNKVKHILKMQKVGHLGTLDPMATGVLLVTLGKATKLFDIMQEKTKTYVATFEFGKTTNTLDATGEVTETSSIVPTKEQIEQILPKFIGEIEQIPPKYSAKSINGKRAYDLARENKEFELKPSKVNINEIQLISYENGILTLTINCGSGTYIRSIGRDLAAALNTVAVMTSLVRISVGNFKLENCHDITEISTENIQEKVVIIKNVLNVNEIKLNANEQAKILNGQTLQINAEDGIYALNDEFDTVALIKVCKLNAKMYLFLG